MLLDYLPLLDETRHLSDGTSQVVAPTLRPAFGHLRPEPPEELEPPISTATLYLGMKVTVENPQTFMVSELDPQLLAAAVEAVHEDEAETIMLLLAAKGML